jgi:hypothetical protein
MVQTHQNSREENTTKPIPLQETEHIWHGSSDPQKVLQLPYREHPDWLHHSLVQQLHGLRLQVTTECTAQYVTGAKLPAIQNLYTRRCQRKALKIVKDSTHLNHRLFSLLPHSKQYRRAKHVFLKDQCNHQLGRDKQMCSITVC